MTNNEVLQHVRYILSLNIDGLSRIFQHAECAKSEEEISDYLTKNGDFRFNRLPDNTLASFLDGLIIELRGKKADNVTNLQQSVNNNIIFNKIKIALALKADDIIEIIALAELTLSKHELSAFFRKPTHKHYKLCHDDTLLRFFNGLHVKHRQAIKELKE